MDTRPPEIRVLQVFIRPVSSMPWMLSLTKWGEISACPEAVTTTGAAPSNKDSRARASSSASFAACRAWLFACNASTSSSTLCSAITARHREILLPTPHRGNPADGSPSVRLTFAQGLNAVKAKVQRIFGSRGGPRNPRGVLLPNRSDREQLKRAIAGHILCVVGGRRRKPSRFDGIEAER